MADSKKENQSLTGERVEVFLKTPLFRFRYKAGGKEQELMENTVRVAGKVLDEKGAGLLLKAEVISNMKETEKNLPFERIFLPFSKIDFVIVE